MSVYQTQNGLLKQAAVALGSTSATTIVAATETTGALTVEYIQEKMALRDDQVYNNIMRYGNTTAASIPIAMSEAWAEGRIKENDVICLAAFGSGFTWASALIRW